MNAALPPPATPGELIARVGTRLGLGVRFEDSTRSSGQIAAPDGRKFYFAGTRMDLNGFVAAELTLNTEASAYYLLRMGYRVPDGRSFRPDEIDAACTYAGELGFPVMVKPTCGHSRTHHSVVAGTVQFRRAMEVLFADRRFTSALVQRRVEGNDFHIIVLEGEVIAAHQCIPLSIVGDGQRTVEVLFEEMAFHLLQRRRHLSWQRRDLRIALQLERLGLTWETIPKRGERVELLDSVSRSMGADLVDFTASVHPAVGALAARIARDIGLRYCGLHLKTDSIETPLADYVVIEVNASPPLLHLLGLGAHEQQLAESIIEKMLLAMTRG